MNEKYNNLYENVSYIPPSVIRKLEKETPGSSEIFGRVSTNGNNSIETITGQSEFTRLLTRDLFNRDVYSDMKNKVMYSTSQTITDHSSLNQL